jgi:hypothetical protein
MIRLIITLIKLHHAAPVGPRACSSLRRVSGVCRFSSVYVERLKAEASGEATSGQPCSPQRLHRAGTFVTCQISATARLRRNSDIHYAINQRMGFMRTLLGTRNRTHNTGNCHLPHWERCSAALQGSRLWNRLRNR